MSSLFFSVGTDVVYDGSYTAVLKRSCTEMDSTVDILGKLMVVLDAGHQRVVANCLLYLTPEELKACRLVQLRQEQADGEVGGPVDDS